LYGVSPGDIQQDPIAFVPYAYQQTVNTGLTIRVTAGDPTAIASAARAAIRASDPSLPLFQVRTMDDIRRLTFWEFALYGWIFGTTGVVGLLLATVGLYGVLSYAVEQRTREIGVRMALGADRGRVLSLIVKHGVALVGLGVILGLAIALAATPLAQNQLFQVSAFDPVSFVGVSVVLVFVALIASYLPARRATRVDPIVVLKGE
jgi:putative ABC transport system permease protein